MVKAVIMTEKMKWINVASEVIDKPFKRYSCPSCDDGMLTICIVPWADPFKKVDIKLLCSNCHESNVITKTV